MVCVLDTVLGILGFCGREKNILRFQVAMNYITGMHVNESGDYFLEDFLSGFFVKRALILQSLI